MKIVQNALELIGNTPLVRLSRVTRDVHVGGVGLASKLQDQILQVPVILTELPKDGIFCVPSTPRLLQLQEVPLEALQGGQLPGLLLVLLLSLGGSGSWDDDLARDLRGQQSEEQRNEAMHEGSVATSAARGAVCCGGEEYNVSL